VKNQAYLLIVDDEEMNLQIMEDLLEDDFEIKMVSNGKECLDSVKERIPELILLDVNMPVMTGIETCKLLKTEPQYKDIPVIFISALALPSEEAAGYAAGGDDYLTKPFSENQLMDKINYWL